MEVGDKVDPVSFGVRRHGRLYQKTDGGDKGVMAEVLDRVIKGLFIVLDLVLVKKIRGGSHSILKTNTKVFCKATIEGLTKDWPGGSNIVLRIKPMVTGERPLIGIGYRCI